MAEPRNHSAASGSASGGRLWRRMSLIWQGSVLQFQVALVLTALLPLLVVAFLLFSPSEDVLSEGHRWLIVALVVVLMGLGWSLLAKYPRTLVQIRRHLADVANGQLPDRVEIANEEDDLAAIQTWLNIVVDQMRQRIATIEEQRNLLLESERQKVMIESMCAACHHLGQPATALTCYLGLLDREKLPEPARQYLKSCLDAAEDMQEVLQKLMSVNEYRTTPYAGSDAERRMVHIE